MRLPKDIKDYRVILMDATVATGAAAMMAIRVLLDHDVKEENINLVRMFSNSLNQSIPSSKLFCNFLRPSVLRKLCRCGTRFIQLKTSFFKVSLLMAEQGVHTIAYAFPKVNIVTTAVDPEINDK